MTLRSVDSLGDPPPSCVRIRAGVNLEIAVYPDGTGTVEGAADTWTDSAITEATRLPHVVDQFRAAMRDLRAAWWEYAAGPAGPYLPPWNDDPEDDR